MYNIIFLGILVLLGFVQFIFVKEMKHRIIKFIVSLSFTGVFLYLTAYIHFLDSYVFLVVLTIFAISLLVLNIICKVDEEDLSIIDDVLHIAYNTILVFILLVIIPTTLYLFDVNIIIKIVLSVIVLGLAIIMNRKPLQVDHEPNLHFWLIFFIAVPLVVLGNSRYFEDIHDRSYIDFNPSILAGEVDVDVVASNHGSWLRYEDSDILVTDDYVYIFDMWGRLMIDPDIEYEESTESYYFTVIDIETDTPVYGKNLHVLLEDIEDTLYVQNDSGHNMYQDGDDIYIVTVSEIFHYQNGGEVERIFTGSSITAYEGENNVYFIANDDLYFLQDGKHYSSVLYDIEPKYNYQSQNGILYAKTNAYTSVREILVGDNRYYGYDMSYLSENMVIVDDKLVTENGYVEQKNGVVDSMISCNSVNYMIGGLTESYDEYIDVITVYDEDFTQQKSLFMSGVHDVFCSNDELYGLTYRNDTVTDTVTYIVKLDTNQILESEPAWYHEYTFSFSNIQANFLVLFVVFFRYSKYAIKK